MSGFRSSKYGRRSSKSRADVDSSGCHPPGHFRGSSRRCTTTAPDNEVVSNSTATESEQLIPYLSERKPRIATTRLRSPSHHAATRICSFKSGSGDQQVENRGSTLEAPIANALKLVDDICNEQEIDSKDDKRESSITSTWKPVCPAAILKVKACSQTQMKRYDYSSTNDESVVEPRVPPRLRWGRDFSKAPNKPQLNLRRSRSLGLTLGFNCFNYESSASSSCTITTTTSDTLASSEITTTECVYCQSGQVCRLCDCLGGSENSEPDTEQLRRSDHQRCGHDLMSAHTNVSAESIWHDLASTECDAIDATTVLDDGELDDNPAWPERDHELTGSKETLTKFKIRNKPRQNIANDLLQLSGKKPANTWRKSLVKLSAIPGALFEPHTARFPLICFVACALCCLLLAVKSCTLCWLFHHMGRVTKNWLDWMPFKTKHSNAITKMSFSEASYTEILKQISRKALDLIQYAKYSAYMPRGSLQDWWEHRAKL